MVRLFDEQFWHIHIVICIMSLCGLANGYQHSEGTYYLHLQGTLKMKTVHSSKTLVKTTEQNGVITQRITIHISLQNLKSEKRLQFYTFKDYAIKSSHYINADLASNISETVSIIRG